MRLFGYRDQRVVSSEPSSPASGLMRYFSAFGKSFSKTSDGVKYDLTRNTSTINVVPNPNDANTGWGTSGAGVTVATTTTSTDLPLEGINGTAIKITPVSGTDYGYFRWTMPFALKSRGVSISWVVRALAGYVSGDLKLELYKNTASNYSGSYTRINLSTDISTVTSIPLTDFKTSFTSDTSDYYELRFIRVSGTTAINLNELSIFASPTSSGTNYFQVKTLTSNFTAGATATEATDLTFTGLTVGKTYRITVRAEYTSGAGDIWMQWGVGTNSANYTWVFGPQNAGGGGSTEASRVFVADSFASTKIYFGGSGVVYRASDNGGTPTALTGGNPKVCYAILEELNNTEVTTAF